MAVHDLDLARFLVGEVEEVHAWGAVLVDERFAKANDADTAVTLLLAHWASWRLLVIPIGDMIFALKSPARSAKWWSKPHKRRLSFLRRISAPVSTILRISRTASKRLTASRSNPFLRHCWKADSRPRDPRTPWKRSVWHWRLPKASGKTVP